MTAFFGTGLLGANFVRALRRRGGVVNVWNRTAAKARVLEAEGATASTILSRRRAARRASI